MFKNRESLCRTVLLGGGISVIGFCGQAMAVNVVMIGNPYGEFGVGEFATTKFKLFSDVPSFQATSLFLSTGGIKVLGSSGRPRIGQSGTLDSYLGITNSIEPDIVSFDRGISAYDNGADAGRNVILAQSGAGSGDTLDLAIVFDIDEDSEGVTLAYVISNPDNGSFTFDTAIAAVDSVPEPSGMSLIFLGACVVAARRSRR